MRRNHGRTLPLAGTVALAAALLAALAGSPAPAAAQGTTPLKVGDDAPNFTLPGATRYGILEEPVSLSDYPGKTVVLAFFFKARTKG